MFYKKIEKISTDIHIYDKNIAIKNYNTFVNSKHFLKNVNNFNKYLT